MLCGRVARSRKSINLMGPPLSAVPIHGIHARQRHQARLWQVQLAEDICYKACVYVCGLDYVTSHAFVRCALFCASSKASIKSTSQIVSYFQHCAAWFLIYTCGTSGEVSKQFIVVLQAINSSWFRYGWETIFVSFRRATNTDEFRGACAKHLFSYQQMNEKGLRLYAVLVPSRRFHLPLQANSKRFQTPRCPSVESQLTNKY
jgi:hypothetical protein